MDALPRPLDRPVGADAFEPLLLTLAWQLMAVLAIGLLAHAVMLAFEVSAARAAGGAPPSQCRRLWMENRVGLVDPGAYELECRSARDRLRNAGTATD